MCHEIFLRPAADGWRGCRRRVGDRRRAVFHPADPNSGGCVRNGRACRRKFTNWKACSNKSSSISPWFDGSFRNLAILRQLTLAFPEDGAVTAKTIEIRDGNTVSCSGTAQRQRGAAGDAGETVAHGGRRERVEAGQQIRGKAPMQFTFDFQYGNGGAQ